MKSLLCAVGTSFPAKTPPPPHIPRGSRRFCCSCTWGRLSLGLAEEYMTTSMRHSSNETLSEKPANGPYKPDEKRKSTRNRLSLTSETSHSAAAGSAGDGTTNLVSSPMSPQHRQRPITPRSGRLDESTATVSTTSTTKSQESKNGKGSRLRSRRSSSSQERSSANETNKKDVNKSDITAVGRSTANISGSLVNHVNHAWEEKQREVAPATTSRSRTSSAEGQRSRASSRKNTSKERHETTSNHRPTSSRQLSTSSSRLPPSADPSPSPVSTPTSSRRVSSSAKSKMKKNQKSMSRSSSSIEVRNTTRSLTSFMQKESSSQPPETEEVLEVRSAYTSTSKSRNRSSKKTTSRSSRTTQMPSTRTATKVKLMRSNKEGLLKNASCHGDSARRNTRAYRDNTRSRSADRNQHDNQDSLSFGANGVAAAATSVSASVQDTVPHDVSSLDGEVSNKTHATQPQRGSSLGQLHAQSRRQHHFRNQSFSSLPVLPEESKRLKKSNSKSSKVSRKSNKTSIGGVSPQELAEFLEQCNTRRKQKEKEEATSSRASGSKSFTLSPISGGRSVASMPTTFAKDTAYRKSTSTRASSNTKEPSSISPFRKPTLSNQKQFSQRSFQTSSSDPQPNHKSVLLEKLRKKVGRSICRETQGSSSQIGQQKGSSGTKGSVKEATSPDVLNESLQKTRPRTKGVNKDAPAIVDKPTDSRTRSLSRSRKDAGNRSNRADPDHARSNNRLDPRRQRPKGFEKLFSIRDLSQGESEPPNSSMLESTTPKSTPTKPSKASGSHKVFRQEANLKAPANLKSVPKTPTPSRTEGVVNSELLQTPPPPLTPYSPSNSVHRRCSSGTRISRASFSSAPGQLYDASSEDGSPRLQQPLSILKNRTDTTFQATGDDTEEIEAWQPVNLYLDSEQILDFEEDLGIAEDVFTHYTWSSATFISAQDLEAGKLERDRLKASIRESLLFNAYMTLEEDLEEE
jgi:hypothetical protein